MPTVAVKQEGGQAGGRAGSLDPAAKPPAGKRARKAPKAPTPGASSKGGGLISPAPTPGASPSRDSAAESPAGPAPPTAQRKRRRSATKSEPAKKKVAHENDSPPFRPALDQAELYEGMPTESKYLQPVSWDCPVPRPPPLFTRPLAPAHRQDLEPLHFDDGDIIYPPTRPPEGLMEALAALTLELYNKLQTPPISPIAPPSAQLNAPRKATKPPSVRRSSRARKNVDYAGLSAVDALLAEEGIAAEEEASSDKELEVW